MNWFKTGICLLAVLAASPASAGPTWKFGPEEQGLLKLEYKGQFQARARDAGAESDGEGTTTEFGFRRNRLALMGAFGEHFGLYVQTEFQGDVGIGTLGVTDAGAANFEILDAALRFKLDPRLNVWVGKFKYGFTRENLEACEMPLTLDRSVLVRAPYVSTRDQGVAVWGNLLGGLFQYRLDAMNGRNEARSSPESQLRYSARAHVSLLDPESDYGYKGTYLGKKKVLTVGAAYQHEGGVAYADTAASAGAVDYDAWTVDAFFEYPLEGIGTFTVSGAYADYVLDSAYEGAAADLGTIGLNGEKNGGYVKAGYLLPGVPLQLFARAETWSFASLDGVFDQRVDWYGAGLNYYLRGQDLKVSAEYSRSNFDKEGVFGDATVEDLNTVTMQLQVIF